MELTGNFTKKNLAIWDMQDALDEAKRTHLDETSQHLIQEAISCAIIYETKPNERVGLDLLHMVNDLLANGMSGLHAATDAFKEMLYPKPVVPSRAPKAVITPKPVIHPLSSEKPTVKKSTPERQQGDLWIHRQQDGSNSFSR